MSHRIAIVASYLPRAGRGGTERQALRAALELAKRGHQVYLFVRGSLSPRCYRRDGICIVERPELRLSPAPHARIPALRFAWDITGGLRGLARCGQTFDVFLAYHTLDAGFVGTAAAVATRTPQVLWIRSQQEYQSADRLRGRLLAPAAWLLSRTILVQTPTMALEFASAASKLLPRRLATRLEQRVKVLPNGLDPPPEIDSPPARPELLFVGRLDALKGIEYLIEALPSVPGAWLTIVGEGEARSRLEDLARGRPVTFVGAKSRNELAEYYRRAALLILPSMSEGLPNVVLEAMSFGRPVVATRIGGLVDVVQHGVTGALVEPGQAAALASAIQSLLRDPDSLRRMGAAARRKALDYSWERLTPRLEQVLAQAMVGNV